MKKIKIISMILILGIMLGAIPATTVAAADRSITADNLTKLATAMNTAQGSLTYDRTEGVGTNFPIFDAKNPAFANLFTITSTGGGGAEGEEAESLMELSSKMEKRYGVSNQISGDIPLPAGNAISLSNSVAYDSTVGSSLSSKQYFNYQILVYEVPTIMVIADWENIDPTDYFTDGFVKEYKKISNVDDARRFLEKYGSHVFQKYCFGGMFEFTKTVVSEVEISQAYSENNVELSLKANYADAIKTATGGNNYEMSADELNNSQTKTKISLKAHGGETPSAFSLDGLFFVTQQIGTATATSYPLKDWTRSLDTDRKDERVIRVEDGIAVWDIVKKTGYHDDNIYSLLKEAYADEYLDSFAKAVKNLDANYSFIAGATSVDANKNRVTKVPYKKELNVSPNTTTTFELDKTYLGETTDFELKLATKAPNGISVSNNKLTVGNVGEETFTIDLYAYGMKLDSVEINVLECPFSGGTGTENDPYIIKTAEEFKGFINDNDYYTQCFALADNIDLGGVFLDVGGSQEKVYFSGTFNGNGYTISNATIYSKSKWGLIGLFGANSGTIKNLNLKDIKCLNQGIISTQDDKLAAGILCGYNKGTIKNVTVSDSAMRVSSYGKTAGHTMSFGGVVGMNDEGGEISYIGVRNVKLYAHSTNTGTNKLNTYAGGIIGRNVGSSLEDAYMIDVKVTLDDNGDENENSTVGSCVGYMEEKAAIKRCVVYDSVEITNKSTNGHLGYICGQQSGKNSFTHCYYDAKISNDKAVDDASCDGCYLKKGSLDEFMKTVTWSKWAVDSEGIPNFTR